MKLRSDKHLNIVVISAALFLTFAAGALAYQANVDDISSEKYFSAVKKALSEARESIYMVMFVARLMPNDKSSSVYQLMDELVKARNRGLKVTLILDQNFDEDKNAWSFKMAKDAGIDVFYDSPKKYTHSKAIVIDAETVILGSTNWTEPSLHKNTETNALIRSKGVISMLRVS